MVQVKQLERSIVCLPEARMMGCMIGGYIVTAAHGIDYPANQNRNEPYWVTVASLLRSADHAQAAVVWYEPLSDIATSLSKSFMMQMSI